jgi:hypothetical protein
MVIHRGDRLQHRQLRFEAPAWKDMSKDGHPAA